MRDRDPEGPQAPPDPFDTANFSFWHFAREVEPGRVLEIGRRRNSDAGWAAIMAAVALAFGAVMTINVHPTTRAFAWPVIAVAAALVLWFGRRFLRGSLYRIDTRRRIVEVERPAGHLIATIPFAEVEGVRLVLMTGSAATSATPSCWAVLTLRHGGTTDTMARSFVSTRGGAEAPEEHETVAALRPLADLVARQIGTPLLATEVQTV